MLTAAPLPFITADLPGCGGQIKAEPDHFIVEEVPLYPPDGAGDHLFASITRSGRTTRQMVDDLAAGLGLRADDIGYAGLKDRQARVTQVFSLPGAQSEAVVKLAADRGWECRWTAPHRTKLRPGHLLGNHFTITILAPTMPEAAPAAIAALQRRGLPNFFGGQRFGRYGDNAESGLAILAGQRPRPHQKWLARLLLSAYQSQLFNDYLALRISRGHFDRLLNGDLAKKTETGGMFIVADVDAEQPRFDRGEITFTGPIFGYDTWGPEGAAAALEAEILASSPVTPDAWRKHHLQGNRRPGKLFVQPIDLQPHPLGLSLRFFLPKGAYATILLRELLKAEPGALDDES